MRTLPLAALCAATLAPAAWAGEGQVDQAEMLDVERCAIEVELQNIYLPASNGDDSAWKFAPTFEYGASDTVSVGLEIEFEKQGNERLVFEGFGLQAKWVAVDPDNAPLGLGVQTSLNMDRHGRIGSETYLIAQTLAEDTSLTANLIYVTEPGDWSEDAFSYVLRADRELSSAISLGAEAGGEISGEYKGRHWIGPILTLSPAAGDEGKDKEQGSAIPAMEFGIFAPLSAKTPDVQFRLELDWEF